MMKKDKEMFPPVRAHAGSDNQITVELKALINDLPIDLRLPFLLSYTGYQNGEIASQLAMSIETVTNKIFYAREQLKSMINNRY